MDVFSSKISPFTSTVIFFDKSPFAHSRRHGGDVTHLRQSSTGHEVHRVRQVLPRARRRLSHRPWPPNVPPIGTDFARHARHFRGERAKLVHHCVNRVLQFQNFAFNVDRNLLRTSPRSPQPSSRQPMLRTCAVKLPAIEFTEVRQILPRAGHTAHIGLTAKLCLRCRLLAPRASLPTQRRKLVDHRINTFFAFSQNFRPAHRP